MNACMCTLTTGKFSMNTGQTEKNLILFIGASATTELQFRIFHYFSLACNCVIRMRIPTLPGSNRMTMAANEHEVIFCGTVL